MSYVMWPKPDDKEFKSFEEHAIAFAMLLGLEPVCGNVTDPGWTVRTWYHAPKRHGRHLYSNSLGELAYRFVLLRGYQMCHDANDDTWSLVKH